jgi:predicted NBD/HSP70 family sugar kinase
MNSSPINPSIQSTGTNLLRAKSHNHRVVLNAARTYGPLTRAQISRMTRLSRQTIQNIIAELATLGYVKFSETKNVEKRRGHPGVMVEFCPDNRFVLGVQIDQFSLNAVLTDLSGRIIWAKKVDAAYPDPETAAKIIKEMLNQLKLSNPCESRRIIHMGLALPGPFNLESDHSDQPTTLPNWSNPTVSQYLEAKLKIPVVIENDASAAAVGEQLFGIGNQLNSFTYIYFGLGLGAGLYLNGSLHQGALKNAGEIGHMVVELNGRSCTCGNRGCLERYASLHAIYDVLDIAAPDQDSIKTAEACFQEKDPRIKVWLKQAVPRLGQAINILEAVLDTRNIIIGGSLPPIILESIVDHLKQLDHMGRLWNKNKSYTMKLGSSGPNTAALGAAALAVSAQIGPQVDQLLKN